MKTVLTLVLSLLISTASLADSFSDQGLYPAVCIVQDDRIETLKEVERAIKELGARGLNVFPPNVIFARMPRGIADLQADGVQVSIYRSAEELPASQMDPIVFKVAGNLLDGEEYKRCLLESGKDTSFMHLDSRLKEYPDISKNYGGDFRGMVGSSSGTDRIWPMQNSEFLIGTVLINIIFPQGSSLVEIWTEEEFAEVVSSIAIGMSDIQVYTSWVDLSFFYNYNDFKWVPVEVEPCQTHWYDHEDWIVQALTSLGYEDMDSFVGTHKLNNDARRKFGTDWVFTAYIADMSNNWDAEMTYYDPRCWGGYSEEHESRSPVSYAMIGGPYLVVSHPACWLDYGIGFYRVFIHEMFHIFWAWDEYCGESCCYVKMGYFNSINWNVCDEAVPCIMQGVRYGPQLCLCKYTMRQLGLVDANENSIPDVFDVKPVVEFQTIPGIMSDTIYSEDYMLSAIAVNDLVENINPFQEERIPDDMNDYGATLAKGFYRVNDGFAVPIKPSDGHWDESVENIGQFVSGFEPGLNKISLEVENCVKLKAYAENDIYYVGLKYYSFSGESREDEIRLDWLTASEVFGAEFEVCRDDLTTGAMSVSLDTVTTPDETSFNRRAYSYADRDIAPGHTYRYRIIGRFGFFDGQTVREFEVASDEIDKKASFPVISGFISNICPNPSSCDVSFTVDVPRSFHDSQDDQSSAKGSRIPHSPGALEIKTTVNIKVYDVAGRCVKKLYELDMYGGLLTLTWDGTDDSGSRVSPGVYFLKVMSGSRISTKKIIII